EDEPGRQHLRAIGRARADAAFFVLRELVMDEPDGLDAPGRVPQDLDRRDAETEDNPAALPRRLAPGIGLQELDLLRQLPVAVRFERGAAEWVERDLLRDGEDVGVLHFAELLDLG